MKAFIIALIVKGKQIEKYRLISIPEDSNYTAKNNFDIVDVEPFKLKYVMKTNKINIINAKIQEDNIIGHGAQLSRYAQIASSNGKLIGKAPLVVLKQLKLENNTIGYVVSDFNGKVVNGALQDVIAYAKINGIANGKVIIRDNKEFISSIQDSYDEAEIVKIGNGIAEEQKIDWTIEEFETYMNKYGFTYGIKNNVLNYIDSRLSFVSVPIGINILRGFTERTEINSNLVKVYIPNTVSYINTDFLDNIKYITEVMISNSLDTLSFLGLQRSENNDAKFNIPTGIEIISGHNNFTLDKMQSADYSNLLKLETITNSNNYARVAYIEFGEAKVIKDSISNLKIESKKIKFNDKIISIDTSFRDITVDEIDFTAAINLKTIGNRCFTDLKIKRIDLSKCINLENIGIGSFTDLPLLEEIIFPDSLKVIRDGCFDNCPLLKNLKLPNKIKTIGELKFKDTPITELFYPKSLQTCEISCSTLTVTVEEREEIPVRFFANKLFKQINLPDTIKNFKFTSFSSCTSEFNIPLSLQIVGGRALSSISNQRELDFGKCTGLKELDTGAIENSLIRYVILSDGVEKLGDNVFKGTTELEFLYLPNTIEEIGKRCFQGMGSRVPLGTTIYTYKNSYAEKYSKQNKFRIVYVESIEEVYEIEKVDNEKISKAKLSKLNLLLSNDSIHSGLLDEKYVNRAGELIGIYGKCTTEEEPIYIELNTDRLTDVQIETVFNAYEEKEIQELRADINLETQSSFNAYINYFTKFTTNMSAVLKHNCLDFIRINGNMIDESIGLKAKIKYQNNILLYFKVIINQKSTVVAMVITGKKVVYTTMFSEKDNKLVDLSFKTPIHKLMPMENVLKTDEAYPFYDTKSNLPSYIRDKLIIALQEQFTIIGHEIIKANKFSQYEGLACIYLLSNTSGKIIEANARFENKDLNGKLRNENIQQIGITNIYDINKLPSKCEKIIADSYFSQTGVAVVLTKMVYEDTEYLNKLKNQSNAYDEPEACIEWELSKAMKDSGITKGTELNHVLYNMIFEMPFFVKVRKKYEDIARLRLIEQFDIEDGLYTIISYEYKGKTNQNSKMIGLAAGFVTMMVDNSKAIQSTVNCFLSCYSLGTIFKDIVSMADTSLESDYYVDDIERDVKDYYLVPTNKVVDSLYYKSISYNASLSLGINKATGIVFLIARYKNSTSNIAYKIFRYRSLSEAVQYSKWLYTNNIIDESGNSKEYKGLCSNTVEALIDIKDKNESEGNIILEVRKMILDGYPNGYALTGVKKYLFDAAAKQRKLT